MMVLGCMFITSSNLLLGANALDESDFYFGEHRIIFRLLSQAAAEERPADVHLLAEELKRHGELEKVGGIAYLTLLAQYAGTSTYLEEYTQLVKSKSILRQMIDSCHLIERSARQDPGDVHAFLDEAQGKLFAISQNANPAAGVSLAELIAGEQYLQELQNKQELYRQKGSRVNGLPSGFVDVDRLIQGLAPSNLLIIAARPAMGKTAFALNIAEHVCFEEKLPVGIFSLEMSSEQLLHRLVCSQANIPSEKLHSGALSGTEYQRVVGAVGAMQEETMIIDDQPGLKITDLRAKARRMKEMHDIRLLVIDYLQLLSGATYARSDNRQNEISEISRMLKNLARELDIPILCLSQLSRKVEERKGHRPLMSDLRESGSIEQDADVVMFLLRQEYYDPYDSPGQAELIVAKNRHGKVGNIPLAFRKEVSRFANLAKV